MQPFSHLHNNCERRNEMMLTKTSGWGFAAFRRGIGWKLVKTEQELMLNQEALQFYLLEIWSKYLDY